MLCSCWLSNCSMLQAGSRSPRSGKDIQSFPLQERYRIPNYRRATQRLTYMCSGLNTPYRSLPRHMAGTSFLRSVIWLSNRTEPDISICKGLLSEPIGRQMYMSVTDNTVNPTTNPRIKYCILPPYIKIPPHLMERDWILISWFKFRTANPSFFYRSVKRARMLFGWFIRNKVYTFNF